MIRHNHHLTYNESILQVHEDTKNCGSYLLAVLQMKRNNQGINNVLLHWSSSAGTDAIGHSGTCPNVIIAKIQPADHL